MHTMNPRSPMPPMFAPCRDGKGILQDHDAEGWLLNPAGRKIVAQCERHALEVLREYWEITGERWTFQEET